MIQLADGIDPLDAINLGFVPGIDNGRDGVVAWQCSLNDAAAHTENIEIPASHLGLGVNPLALYAVADRLRADWLKALAAGHDPRPVQPDRASKSSGSECTYEHDLTDLDRIRAEAARIRDRSFARVGGHLANRYSHTWNDGFRIIGFMALVGRDAARSRELYDWVLDVVRQLGARDADLVPFEKYAAAAQSLGSPSSAARALAAGAQYIERVDRLAQASGERVDPVLLPLLGVQVAAIGVLGQRDHPLKVE